MIGWLILITYAIGYAFGVRYALDVFRRALADNRSDLWDYNGRNIETPLAVVAGIGCFVAPLIWPIIGLGLLAMRLALNTTEIKK